LAMHRMRPQLTGGEDKQDTPAGGAFGRGEFLQRLTETSLP